MTASMQTLPPDDPARGLTVARPETDDAALAHVAIAGDTYTILLGGDDTAGRFTLIDMLVPRGGGPPPHRHDFEETFGPRGRNRGHLPWRDVDAAHR
jgi:hypothetical protein